MSQSFVDSNQVRRLSAPSRTIIDNLAMNFVGSETYYGHEIIPLGLLHSRLGIEPLA